MLAARNCFPLKGATLLCLSNLGLAPLPKASSYLPHSFSTLPKVTDPLTSPTGPASGSALIERGIVSVYQPVFSPYSKTAWLPGRVTVM